jgi:hypothetical protein
VSFIDLLFGRPAAAQPQTVVRPNVQAFTLMDMDSPVLAEFIRSGTLDGNTLALGELSANDRKALRNSTFFGRPT